MDDSSIVVLKLYGLFYQVWSKKTTVQPPPSIPTSHLPNPNPIT